MALLFCDSFNHIDDGYDVLKWDAGSVTGISYSSGIGRLGDWGVQVASGSGLDKSFGSNKTTIILGLALKTENGSTSAEHIQFYDGATLQAEIRIDPSGAIHAYRGSSTLLGSSADGVFPINAWAYLEIKILFSNTVGTVEVKVNEATVLNLTSKDTVASGNEYATAVRLEGNGGDCNFDDFYLCDDTGSVNDDFLGDVQISVLYPTSDETHSDFTPSTGSDHYALVDDPQLTSDADHNESTTVGHKDTYGVTTFSGSNPILGVQICSAVKNTDVGVMSVRNLLISGTSPTETEGASLALSQTMQGNITVYDKEPVDDVAWTAAKVNAAEIGLKVQA